MNPDDSRRITKHLCFLHIVGRTRPLPSSSSLPVATGRCCTSDKKHLFPTIRWPESEKSKGTTSSQKPDQFKNHQGCRGRGSQKRVSGAEQGSRGAKAHQTARTVLRPTKVGHSTHFRCNLELYLCLPRFTLQ